MALNTTPGGNVRSGRNDSQLVPDNSQRGAPGHSQAARREALCAQSQGGGHGERLCSQAIRLRPRKRRDWQTRAKGRLTPRRLQKHVTRGERERGSKQKDRKVQRANPNPGTPAGPRDCAARAHERSGPQGTFHRQGADPAGRRQLGSHVPTHS